MDHFLICAVALLCAVELSDDERERVEEYRKATIVALSAEVRGLQKDLRGVRDKQKASEIKDAIASRKRRMNETKRAPAEDLFKSMVDSDRARAADEFKQEQAQRREKELAEAGPVAILGMGINTNAIGLPEITLEVQNNTDETVEAVEFEADCFNKFDEPVEKIGGGHRFGAHWKYEIPANAKERISAQMSLQRSTAKADVWISRVRLKSGKVWTQNKEQAARTPYGLAKARLME